MRALLRKTSHSKRPPAVVVGLSITGLGTARSLASAGIRVIGVDSAFAQPSSRTRHCEKVYCADITKPNDLLATLISISKTTQMKPVLFLSTDASVIIASDNRDILGDYYHYNLPAKSVVSTFMDKALFADFASRNGFQIPHTFVVRNVGEVTAAADVLRFPCLVKPSFRSNTWDKVTPTKAFKVVSKKELMCLYQEISKLAAKFVIQELIPGTDREIYFALLWYNSASKPRASFVGRKVVQWPPEVGSTCIGESCCNDLVLRQSLQLFDIVEYRGIGSVEYKWDSRDQRLKIIEPTVGRADLQSALAFHAGINIPLLEYCDRLNLKLPELPQHIKKISWINEENLFWLVGNHSKGITITDWIHLATSKRCYALLDILDFKPFLFFLRLVVRTVLFKTKTVYVTNSS